jgi:hypothetical protein
VTLLRTTTTLVLPASSAHAFAAVSASTRSNDQVAARERVSVAAHRLARVLGRWPLPSQHVLAMRHWLQVVGVHAVAYSTEVVERLRHRLASVFRPTPVVGFDDLPGDVDTPVAFGVGCSVPDPAWRSKWPRSDGPTDLQAAMVLSNEPQGLPLDVAPRAVGVGGERRGLSAAALAESIVSHQRRLTQ